MSRTIIHSVTVFDGTSVHPISVVTIDGISGLIESIVPTDGVPVAEAAGDVIVNGIGCTLIPGLIDGHVHLHKLHLPAGADNSDALRPPLQCGITTVYDLHCEEETINQFRKQVDDELVEARKAGSDARVTQSDFKSSLLAATIKDGWPKPIVLGHDPTPELHEKIAAWPSVTVDNAMDFVKSHKAKGADYIKLMQEDCCSLSWGPEALSVATPELQAAVVEAAHANGLLAVGHALSVSSTATVLNSGADGLTHTFFDQPPTREIIELYKKTGAFVTPTLAMLCSLASDEYDLRRTIADVALQKGIIDEDTRQKMLATMDRKAATSKMEYAYESVRQLNEAGIDVVAGTDALCGAPGVALGPSLWMELQSYVTRCGMTPAEALSSATATSARRFGFTDRGTVEAGKRADLVLVKGKPFENIQCLWEGEGIIAVWKQGIRARESG